MSCAARKMRLGACRAGPSPCLQMYRRLFACVLVLVVSPLAGAGSKELGVIVGHSAARLDSVDVPLSDATATASAGAIAGGRFNVNFLRYLGLDIAYLSQSVEFRTAADASQARPTAAGPQSVGSVSVRMHTASTSILVHFRGEGKALRPFLAGGLGITGLAIPHISDAAHKTVQVGSTHTYGGGVKYRLGAWGVRMDLRDSSLGAELNEVVRNLHGFVALPRRLRNLRYTATVSWVF